LLLDINKFDLIWIIQHLS